jgi:hypothetical protein
MIPNSVLAMGFEILAKAIAEDPCSPEFWM